MSLNQSKLNSLTSDYTKVTRSAKTKHKENEELELKSSESQYDRMSEENSENVFHYLFIDWSGTPPSDYTSKDGTLVDIHKFIGGPAVLPVVGGELPLRLITFNNYNALETQNAVQAGIVLGFIKNAYPDDNIFFVCVSTSQKAQPY